MEIILRERELQKHMFFNRNRQIISHIAQWDFMYCKLTQN